MDEQSVRLAKRMAELGLCSRREADDCIERGWVRVDGEVVQQLGSRVCAEQKIELLRPSLPPEDAQVTLLLYKPPSYPGPAETLIRAETRAAGDRSGVTLLARHCRQLIQAGALDPRVYGLLALTQDGRLARKLLECELEFLVQLDHAPDVATLKLLAREISGKVTRQSDRQLRFVLRQAQAEQIWTLCQAAATPVLSVRCIRIGRIALGDLQAGQWRFLMAYEHF
jgi:23S rRNA pseudouridine2604 synthase